jgi:hypothetical protein
LPASSLLGNRLEKHELAVWASIVEESQVVERSLVPDLSRVRMTRLMNEGAIGHPRLIGSADISIATVSFDPNTLVSRAPNPKRQMTCGAQNDSLAEIDSTMPAGFPAAKLARLPAIAPALAADRSRTERRRRPAAGYHLVQLLTNVVVLVG